MSTSIRTSIRKLKLLAFASISIAVILLIALCVIGYYYWSNTTRVDDRLIGTWQSDGERTIATMKEQRKLNDKQVESLNTLFGKLQITYTNNREIRTSMNDSKDSGRFEIVGMDKNSVVIREYGTKRPDVEYFNLSEYQVIYFDGPDAYWVYTQIGGVKEYFKRVKN